jgi:predicted kinase
MDNEHNNYVGTLYIPVGLPRSGKSTWAKSFGPPIVCPDSIRLAIHGKPFDPTYEKEVWRTARIMVESLFISGHRAVILDATNLSKKNREAWKDDRWTRYYQPFTDVSREVCKGRALATNQEYLLPVIDRMAFNYEPLSEEEFDSDLTEEDYSLIASSNVTL